MLEEFYPDLAELGGLQRALVQESRQEGLDLGVMAGATSDPFEDPSSAKLLSDRGTIMIYLGAEERRFYISIASVQHSWAEGVTDDLSSVVGVAKDWQNGVTLAELNSRFPFMEYSDLAQAYEGGNPVAIQWGSLLHDEVFAEYRPLTREIYAHEQLRALFPFYSMGMLRLSTDHTSRQAGEIRISPLRTGGYRVESTVSGRETHVENMDRIAETAVAFLDAS
ncbi:DUF6193 family natural product biosynthesis protein [Streptomyces sp. NPDC047525]|uniref:DUF6193 family natural product biosynthesis protein n=1 Tax=Streptomyces sp. NPDC047525 TaxID=3155264 RepID=UPI0033EB1749